MRLRCVWNVGEFPVDVPFLGVGRPTEAGQVAVGVDVSAGMLAWAQWIGFMHDLPNLVNPDDRKTPRNHDRVARHVAADTRQFANCRNPYGEN